MDGTSAQPQVNLSLLRSNSLKFQPQVIYSSLAWQIRIVLVNIKFFCKKQSQLLLTMIVTRWKHCSDLVNVEVLDDD
jgi:hypothetical protein